MGTRKEKEGKTGDKEGKCGDRGENVLDTDSGLQYEVCDLWYHNQCQKVSDDMFEF